ncbi:hypothetical protein [Crenobacter intestini]|uniref:DAC domain-containing protein n=1 Tax=Crenobacter intestini TaxID=2563443 RepID=A0A4T0UM37_9NEIS|nr:hypothetical protein [Crenobacter intestini]TIC79698.1 hypothetical protein E5K04_13225 [Crenobacter intestini]
MTIDELREALGAYLAPLLSAQVLPETVFCRASSPRVAALDPTKTAIKAEDRGVERLVLYRQPGFMPEELTLTKDFVEELVAIHDATDPDYRSDLFTFLPARAISRHLGDLAATSQILRQFEAWSARTYEGGAITSSIGIDPNANSQEIYLAEIFQEDFSAVISNGFDTLLVVTPDCKISGSGQLTANQLGLEYVPYRLNAIADWTNNDRIALVLNRLGEQLIFRNKKLIFAKRRGEWQYYAHELYLRQIQPPQNRVLREAIYQSCLDISFTRSGGCIIVIKSGKLVEIKSIVSEPDLLLGENPSIKSKTIRTMVNEKFQNLDRRLRQELLALDGAMVLDHLGNIIAVGAIISVPAGSEGGGRTAAAKKGSSLGLGIKISEDGGISVYKEENKVFVA